MAETVALDPREHDELVVDPLEVLRQRRSAKWRTYPEPVLPLTVAEMDYPLAPAVTAVLQDAVLRSDTGYALAEPELGEALASFAGARWGWSVDPTAVIPVADVGVGVVELLRVLVPPGRSVVVSPPVYPPFFGWAPEAGAALVEVPLTRGADGVGPWRLDLPALARAFAAGAGVYLLCNPHNPVGRVHRPEELAELVALASRYGVTIVSDEIHAPLVLPGATFTPLLTVPGAAELGVSLLSASKAFNLAGLKCAAVVTASPTMATALERLPPDTRWRVGHLGVLATVAAFTAGTGWLDQLLTTLDHRRTQLGDLLARRLPTLRWVPPEATYLGWLDASAVGAGDDPRTLFLEQARVALEPGPRFGALGSGHVRLNFATSPEILDRATAAMAQALG